MHTPSRRRFLQYSLGAMAPLAGATFATRALASTPCVIIGSGPAGAAAALALRAAAPGTPVTMVERDPRRLMARGETQSSPFHRPAPSVRHLDLQTAGVELLLDEVATVDWSAGQVALLSGRRLDFERLVLATGSAPRPEAIAGYDRRTPHLWPAAWGSAREARRLTAQLAALPPRGHVVLRLPADAAGAPEVAAARALVLARYLARHKPSARLTVLDAAKNSATARIVSAHRQPEDRMDWFGPGAGGSVRAIDAPRGLIETDAGALRADAVNFVVPQRAADVARNAGLVDSSGWCPCEPDGRSVLNPAAIVLGDARKSARRTLADAVAQGQTAARAILAA
ncbi:FAD-dependent oxidoreductase [Tropicimonas marinistellae]|uniref:FAD-dependent oxidoreductase n=1 Tax=Tropicimonas marinistellae TaxID=1739787 RepID=UPI00082ADAFA|nr:FAD-dependent oxidoreductase [Tropicimonas marinistellae]